MTDAQIKKRLLELKSIPMNDDEEILEDFYEFPKGTTYFEILWR